MPVSYQIPKALKAIFFVTICILPVAALGGDCSDVLLDKPGAPMEKLPVYDQKGSSICYAYTAVQLIDAYRFSHGEKGASKVVHSSPEILAVDHSRINKISLYGGSETCLAIETARKIGVCDAGSVKGADELYMWQQLYDEYRANPAARMKQTAKECNLNQVQLLSLETIFKNPNSLEFISVMISSSCEGNRVKVKLPHCEVINEETVPSSTFRAKVDSMFNRASPQPVQIGYSKNIFSYKPKESYVIARHSQTEEEFMRYNPHASMLIGRRMNKAGRCQYLLRNTMGTSFCPTELVRQRGWECAKKGDIWVNADELMDSTFEVSFLDDTK